MRSFIFILCCLTHHLVKAQDDTSTLDLSAYIHLDSIVITAEREGFNVEEFIDIIRQDQSLENSFNNLRKQSYSYRNKQEFWNRKGKLIASYSSLNTQRYDGKCQWMEVMKEEVSGKFYKKKKKYRFYTSKLYHRVFYASKTPCDLRQKTKSKPSRSQKLLEKRISELKKLIYRPGQRAKVPLIGSKTAIFDPEIIDFYEFSISSKSHRSGQEVYLFTAKIKPQLNAEQPDATVVKYMEVFVEKGSLQVLSRNYKLQYNAGIYDFDVAMQVDLAQFQNQYIPSEIRYSGHWEVGGGKREDCKFSYQLVEFLD